MALAPRRGRPRQFANQDNSEKVDLRADAANLNRECTDWKLQIKLAEKRNEKWLKRAKKIVKRYRQETDDNQTASHRMNMLWSNVQTLEPCVYGREPVPIAERRFLDKDITGRVASQMLERAMRYEMADCGFHDSVQQCVKDYLLVGRGVAWLRYKPIIGPATSLGDLGDDELGDRMGMPGDPDETPHPEEDAHNESNAQTDEPPAEKLLSASLDIDYVHFSDFVHSPARWWKENTWVARKYYPSRKDLIDDFGEKVGKAVPLTMGPERDRDSAASARTEEGSDSLKKAVAFEIWDKSTRKVYIVADGYEDFLKEPEDDPLNLENFFPCAKPLFATMTNDTLDPVPDYIEYQDQALQIDKLTGRIDLLISALKVAGVYDSAQKELGRLLDEGHENKLIPVPNWAAFSAKGGLPTSISFLPIKEISDVLMGLTQARDKIKADMFEITGLSDIIRGQADPRETAAAVQTKGRWGSLRLQARQANVARFCRDIISMMGEIISEHFPAETLINISGAMYDEGIGGDAPVAPKEPQSPMMGHNGGPPMGAPPQTPVPTPAPPMGSQPVMGPSLPPHPPMLASGPPQLATGAPPPPNPMLQYQMQMLQYQHDAAVHQAKKQQLIMAAIDLLRQDKLRGFRIDIETDSTVQSDATEEKQARTEFIKATTQFMEEAFKIGQQIPEAAPMLGKMLLFGVRGFRAGRDLESSIEEFVDQMEKDAKAKIGMPPPPNPELQKQQMEMQAIEAKSQAEIAKAKIDAQSSADDNQREMASKQMDQQMAQQQMAMDSEKMKQEAAMRNAEFEMKMQEMRMQMELQAREHAQKLHLAGVQHEQSLQQLAITPQRGAVA